jgi:pimeloyl-ACP methyl ester carboxylesterase
MYAEAFSNGEFAIIEYVSHFPYEEQPAAFAYFVQDFLEDLD